MSQNRYLNRTLLGKKNGFWPPNTEGVVKIVFRAANVEIYRKQTNIIWSFLSEKFSTSDLSGKMVEKRTEEKIIQAQYANVFYTYYVKMSLLHYK